MNRQVDVDTTFRPWPAPHNRRECCAVRQPVLRTVGLGVDYDGVPALRDVDMTIDRGCITAIVGPSGCGKSTFLSTLNRMTDLEPGACVHGEVHLDNEPLYGGTPDLIALRRRVGMIFQRPNPFPLTVRRNITFPLREHGIRDHGEQDDIVEDCLRRVGLWSEVSARLDRSALGLSGGQQQRLCLARALALRPDVLLLDEPCSALDPLAGGCVEDLIASLRGDYTVVIVTHNLAQARRIADDVALFWTRDGVGALVESGRTDDLFYNPRHELTAAYINGIRG